MGFVISNRKFEGAEEFEKLYFDGSDVITSNASLIAVKTNVFGKKRREIIDNVLEQTSSDSTIGILSKDEFYVALSYKINSDILKIQTDIVAYESAFIYRSGDCFVISDNVLRIIEILQSFGITVALLEDKVRKFVYLGNYFTSETFFSDISILQPATNYFLNIYNLELQSSAYDDFSFSGKITDADEAASRLYSVLDELFKSNYSKDMKYGIGISGGLDSRVAGYFAKKNGYNVYPYFLGRKRNSLGFLTNDAKRSLEVIHEIGLNEPSFYPTDIVPYSKKLEYDAVKAPTGSPNVTQNIGFDWPYFDVMIHGMLGGELFGGIGFLNKNNMDCTSEELSASIIATLNCLPKYKAKYSLSGKIITKLPKIRDKYRFTDYEKERIISERLRTELKSELCEWIERQNANGLSNINIAMKFFYYYYSRNVRTAYYATLEDSIYSFGAFLNPKVISEFRNWSDGLFLNRVVQKALIKKCGNLCSVRDQTTAASISESESGRSIRKYAYMLERALRGSGMYYTNYDKKEFASQLQELNQQKIIRMFDCDFVELSEAKADVCHLIMKLAWLEKRYNLPVADGDYEDSNFISIYQR